MTRNEKANVLLGMDNNQFVKKLKESQNALKSTMADFKTVYKGLAIGASIGAIAKVVDMQREQIRSEKLVASVIKSTGNAAGVTSGQLRNMAADLQEITNYGDDAVLQGQKLLLTFTNIKGDTFRDATKAMLDMSTVLGQDLEASAKQVGKALQDPIKGVNALRKVGVMMTDEQKNQIKTFMKLGDVASAQKVILNELSVEYGEAAKNMASPTKQLANDLNEAGEAAGSIFKPGVDKAAESLRPLVKEATAALSATAQWNERNHQLIGSIADLGLVLAVCAGGFTVIKVATIALQAEYLKLTAISGKVTYSQIFMSAVLQGQFRPALTAATLQVRAFTASLLANPFTWVALGITAVGAAFYALQQSAKQTQRVIEDLNTTQKQNVDKTTEAIRTIKELQSAKNLDLNQTKRLDEAIANLTALYPKYINKLKEELHLKGEISRATAEQIAHELMLEKVKGYQKERTALNKDMQRDMKISNVLGRNHAGGRYGISKANQLRDDALNSQAREFEKEEKAIINTFLNATKAPSASAYGISGLEDERKKDAKEALNRKLALLDQEKYARIRSAEEIYQIELKKVNLQIAADKKGSADYHKHIADKLKLEQDYAKQVVELNIQLLSDKQKIENYLFEQEKETLNQQLALKKIDQETFYKKELELLQEKFNKEIEFNTKKMELYRQDKETLRQIEQEKFEIIQSYNLEKYKIENQLQLQMANNLMEFKDAAKTALGDTVSNFLQGNKTLKESFLSLFDEIKNAWFSMIAQMVAKQAMLFMFGGNGSTGLFQTAGSALMRYFKMPGFASGGIIPGSYSDPVPIIAHGQEMVLNTLQQAKLFNMIQNGQSASNRQNEQSQQPASPIIMSPVFQSLDPKQGQKMFEEWFQQSGLSMVGDAIKTNKNGMRQLVASASG